MSLRRPGVVAIVEDDPEQLELAREFFEDEGITALAYERVPRIEQVSACRTPDVVILDACLRDSSDADTVRLAQDAWPTSPIVIWTAHTDAGLRVKCLEAGCDDIVIKSDPDMSLSGLFRVVRDAHLRRVGWRHRVADDAVAAARQALVCARRIRPAIDEMLTPSTASVGGS